MSDVAVVEVETSCAEDARGEVELSAPVFDDAAAEEPLAPGVHLGGDLLGDLEEEGLAGQGDPQAALVVEGHGGDLAEGVLPVEHPAIGAREEGVGDVAEVLLEGCVRLRGGAGALDPLAAQVGGDVRAREPALAGVLDADRGAADRGARGEEVDARVLAKTLCAPLRPLRHEVRPVPVEVRERIQCVEGLPRVHVGVGLFEAVADFETHLRLLVLGRRRYARGRRSSTPGV